MKTAILLSLALCVAALPSCTTAKGKDWQYASVGSKAKGLDVTAEGMHAEELDDSISLRHVGRMLISTIGSYFGFRTSQVLSADHVAVVKSNDATELGKHLSDNAVKMPPAAVLP